MTNAGAKLQNKYEIFLRSTEKFSFLTICRLKLNVSILVASKFVQVKSMTY